MPTWQRGAFKGGEAKSCGEPLRGICGAGKGVRRAFASVVAPKAPARNVEANRAVVGMGVARCWRSAWPRCPDPRDSRGAGGWRPSRPAEADDVPSGVEQGDGADLLGEAAVEVRQLPSVHHPRSATARASGGTSSASARPESSASAARRARPRALASAPTSSKLSSRFHSRAASRIPPPGIAVASSRARFSGRPGSNSASGKPTRPAAWRASSRRRTARWTGWMGSWTIWRGGRRPPSGGRGGAGGDDRRRAGSPSAPSAGGVAAEGAAPKLYAAWRMPSPETSPMHAPIDSSSTAGSADARHAA